MPSQREIVEQFHERFNAGDTASVLDMATEDIAVGGARGRGNGRQLLNEWVERKLTSLTPLRWFERDDIVAVEEHVRWHSRDGARVTDETVWAMVFQVTGDRLSRVGRYANIGEAITTFGMFESDEISEKAAG